MLNMRLSMYLSNYSFNINYPNNNNPFHSKRHVHFGEIPMYKLKICDILHEPVESVVASLDPANESDKHLLNTLEEMWAKKFPSTACSIYLKQVNQRLSSGRMQLLASMLGDPSTGAKEDRILGLVLLEKTDSTNLFIDKIFTREDLSYSNRGRKFKNIGTSLIYGALKFFKEHNDEFHKLLLESVNDSYYDAIKMPRVPFEDEFRCLTSFDAEQFLEDINSSFHFE